MFVKLGFISPNKKTLPTLTAIAAFPRVLVSEVNIHVTFSFRLPKTTGFPLVSHIFFTFIKIASDVSCTCLTAGLRLFAKEIK